MAEFLAGFRDDGGVNDGEHFFDMFEKQPVKENFVGVLELAEVDVALEIVVLAKIGFVGAGGLLFDGFDDGREEAVEAKGLALRKSEGSTFVQCGNFQNNLTAQMRRELGRWRRGGRGGQKNLREEFNMASELDRKECSSAEISKSQKSDYHTRPLRRTRQERFHCM